MKKLAVITASLLAAFSITGVTTLTQAPAHAATVAAGSPSLSVNKLYTTTTKVTGKATKGVKIVVRTAKKKTLATATASKTTGKFSVTLPSKQKNGTKLYVYAKNTKTGRYFYRIVTVQKKATATTTSKKTTTKKTTSAKSSSTKKSSSSFKVATPTGTWKSTSYKGYAMKFVFSQKTGLNEYVTKGSKTAHVLKNATYSVSPKTTTFWKVNVKAKGGKKSSFYMRFTAKNKFILVNSKNHAIKTSVGKAPAAYYTFKK